MSYQPSISSSVWLSSLLGIFVMACQQPQETATDVKGLSSCITRIEGAHYLAALLPYDGSWPIGVSIELGLIQATEEINIKGGIRGESLGLVLCNTRGHAYHAEKSMREVIDAHPISGVIGPMFGTEAQAVAPWAISAGIPMLAPSVAALNSGDPAVFGMAPSAEIQGMVLSRICQDSSFSSATIIRSDDADDIAITQAFTDDFANDERGVTEVAYTADSASYANEVVTAALVPNSAAVVLLGAPTQAASIIRTAVERNLTPQRWLLGTRLRSNELLANSGATQPLESAFGLGTVLPTREQRRIVGGNYLQIWGRLPGPYVFEAYDAVYVLAIAMLLSTNPDDRAEVRQHLMDATHGITIKPGQWSLALQNLDSGALNYEGASGPVDLSDTTPATVQVEQWLVTDAQFDTYRCWTGLAESCEW